MRFARNSPQLIIALALVISCAVLLSLYVSGAFGNSSRSSSPQSNAIVPMLWESTIYNMSNGETAVQAAAQLHANFIFRGAFQWGYTQVQAGPEASSSFFVRTAASIKALKESDPRLIYEGGFGTQYLPDNATWVNGTAVSKQSFNSMVGKNSSGGWLPLSGYQGLVYQGYVANLASPAYRTYVIQWSERQIDEGVDGMFFDEPYEYANYLVGSEHQNATTVYNEYAAYMKDIVQALKSYASAHGRTFFATINSGACDQVHYQLQYPASISFVSYVSCSADVADFNATANPSFQPVENFTQIKAAIAAVVNVPVMVFVDWPPQQFTLGNLTTGQQVTALTNLYRSVTSSRMLFVYEIFHHRPLYDSVLEGTYSTWVQLSSQSDTSSNSLAISPILPAVSVLPLLTTPRRLQFGAATS